MGKKVITWNIQTPFSINLFLIIKLTMKKIYFLLIAALLYFPGLFAQDFSTMRGSEICSQRHTIEGRNALVLSPNSPRHSFDVLDYNLDLDIYQCYTSPYPKNYTATANITFRVDSTLSFIILDADNTSLQIQSVANAGVSFNHEDDLLKIFLDREYLPGEVAEVGIEYSHTNVTDGAFNVGNGFVFTDAEPQGARKWFPCYDRPSDKATLQLRAKVPSNVKLGSNGRLADSTQVNDTIWYTWISRDPIATYIMVLTSKVNYKLDVLYHVNPAFPNDTLPIRFYYNQNENPDNMIAMLGPLTNFFESKFGKHPFEKNGFATVNNLFQWGGMENQTLTTLCQNCWYSSVVTHEYAHQWFGDMITCATWADLWLNEGFATYIETLWILEQEGHESYMEENLYNASYYMYQNPGWPISDPDWAINPPSNDVLFNYAVTYLKGACVLYMFHQMVGDSLFYHSIYEYANDTVNFRYHSATITDFIDKMNETTGMDISWFFEQWIYTPNHPEYLNTYSIHQQPNDQWEVKLNIKQTQSNAGFFTMPVEIKVKFAIGDTLISIQNDANDQNFSFFFDSRPTILQFDPNDKIILKNSTTVVDSKYELVPKPQEIKIKGNPSEGNINLYFNTSIPCKANILVHSGTGVLIYEKQNLMFSYGETRVPLNLTHLTSGTYILTLTTDDNVLTEKLLIVK